MSRFRVSDLSTAMTPSESGCGDGVSYGQSQVLGPGGRFAVRSAGALVAVVVVGATFGLVAALVRVEWEPMRWLDLALADGLNDLLSGDAVLSEVLRGVTDLGGTATLLWLLVVSGLWLLLRRQPRLAVYVAVSTLGAMILNAVVKELVGRLRPVVHDPVYTVPGLSFPSGHAMNSLVTYGRCCSSSSRCCATPPGGC